MNYCKALKTGEHTKKSIVHRCDRLALIFLFMLNRLECFLFSQIEFDVIVLFQHMLPWISEIRQTSTALLVR